jgi:hypothetical protein
MYVDFTGIGVNEVGAGLYCAGAGDIGIGLTGIGACTADLNEINRGSVGFTL